MVEHDDVNVLCLGSRVVGQALAEDLVKTFIDAKFSREDRHVRRLEKIRALEG
jgi:ribose 5-phosphate isomerase B